MRHLLRSLPNPAFLYCSQSTDTPLCVSSAENTEPSPLLPQPVSLLQLGEETLEPKQLEIITY